VGGGFGGACEYYLNGTESRGVEQRVESCSNAF